MSLSLSIFSVLLILEGSKFLQNLSKMFSAFVLTEFLRECVVDYVNDTNLSVRKEAVVCCCKLMGGIVEQPQRHYQLIVSEVLEKLLALGTADPGGGYRLRYLQSRCKY